MRETLKALHQALKNPNVKFKFDLGKLYSTALKIKEKKANESSTTK